MDSDLVVEVEIDIDLMVEVEIDIDLMVEVEIDIDLMVEVEIDIDLMVVAEIGTDLMAVGIDTDLIVVGHHIVVRMGLGLLLHKAAVAEADVAVGEGNYIVD